MAYNADPNNPDENEQKKTNPNNDVSTAAPGAGSVGVGGANGPGAPMSEGANQGAAAPSGGNRFVNLQKYLNANQGAGANMANQIGQKVGEQGEEVNKTIAQNNTLVGGQLDAEKNRIAQASGFAQQVAADPTQIAGNADQLGQFQKLYAGQTGVGNIQNAAAQGFGNAQTQLGQFQQTADMTGNEAGRFDLLRQTLGRPTYTQGQQKLDQLLVQSGGNGILGNLQKNAANQTKAAGSNLAASQAEINAGLQQRTAEALAAQQALTGAVGSLDQTAMGGAKESGAFGSLQDSLRAKQQDFINQANTQKTDLTSQIAEAQRTGTMSQALADKLGLANGQKLYGVDLSAVVNPQFQPGTVTEQSVANDVDLARYKALAQLSGTNPNYLNAGAIGGAQGPQISTDSLNQQMTAAKQHEQDVLQEIANNRLGSLGFNEAMTGMRGMQGYQQQDIDTILAQQAEARKLNPDAQLDDETQARLNKLQSSNAALSRYGILNPNMSEEDILRTAYKNRADIGTGLSGEAVNANNGYWWQPLYDLMQRSDYYNKINPDRVVKIQ